MIKILIFLNLRDVFLNINYNRKLKNIFILQPKQNEILLILKYISLCVKGRLAVSKERPGYRHRHR